MKCYKFMLMLMLSFVFAEPPVVENVTANQRTDGSKIVDIYYDVSDADGDLVTITLQLSDDGGTTFTIEPTQTTGDIGADIEQGTNKHIIWEAGEENFTLEGNQYQFKVIADDTIYCTDIDGNVYETVIIGEQIWTTTNLKVTHYRNGDPIPTGYNNSEWSNLDDTETGAYAVYNDQESNADTYGYLYNWYAVDDSRNIAPEGWHIPTDEEWMELEMYLGMSESEANSTGWRGTDEGSQLAGRADLWNSGDLENNANFGTSGFTALPAGYRSSGGYYYHMGDYGCFWSSTESTSVNAWPRVLYCYYSVVYRYTDGKENGFTVRVLKD